MSVQRLSVQLDNAEREELERFLSSPSLAETAMDLVGVDGYFAAVLSGPRTIVPSEWIPSVWDPDGREVTPEYGDLGQANRILELLMRHYNAVARALMDTERPFVPIYPEADTEAAASWCAGYLAGVALDAEAWKKLVFSHPAWFAPILGLGTSEEKGEAPSLAQARRWAGEVGRSVAKIHLFWLEERRARKGSIHWERQGSPGRAEAGRPSRVGRNDPCPCSSGKKFKRCCGAARPA